MANRRRRAHPQLRITEYMMHAGFLGWMTWILPGLWLGLSTVVLRAEGIHDEAAAAIRSTSESSYRIVWSRIADYPVRLSELSAIAMGDRIYVIGGKMTNDNQDLADNRDVDYTYEYDPGADEWMKRATMPTARYDVALAVLNDRLYAISSSNESYDPVSDTWQKHAPLPHGGAHLAGTAVGGEIFMFGAEGPKLCSQNMAFEATSGTWRARAPIPTPRWLSSVVAELDGKIYLMGGLGYDAQERLGPVHRDVEIYDPATNRWARGPSLPEGVFGGQGAGVFEGKVFLVGAFKGERLAESRTSEEIYVLDPHAGTWNRTTDLPHSHGSAAVAFYENRIYLVGGHDESFRQFREAYVGVIEKVDSKNSASTQRKPLLPRDVLAWKGVDLPRFRGQVSQAAAPPAA